MATGASIVGNSKVLAHALPNLVPPIDREYTLRFLFGKTNVRNDIDYEWHIFRQLLENFFYPLLRVETLESCIDEWMSKTEEFRWDTSPLKVIDNLVIGLLKLPASQLDGTTVTV